MLKILFGVIVVLALLIGTALLMGSRLPVKHQATRSVVVPVAPSTLFSLISDPASAPSWRKDLKSVDLLPPSPNGHERYREHNAMGTITMEVVESVHPSRRVTKIVDEDQGFGGSWAFAVEAAPEGARLTITEHGEVYTPLFRFMSKYVFGHNRTLETYLGHVRAKLGGNGTIDSAPPVPLEAASRP